MLRKGDVAAARPRFIQVQTKHLDHSGDCIGGIRWTRTTTLPPSRKSEGSMLHLPGVFGCLTCLHGEVMGTYQGSLGHFGPRGPGPGHAGAWARAPGPGPGMARGPKDPKGRIRQGPDPWHPLAGACRCPLFCERGFRHPKNFQKVRKCSAVRRFEILHLRSPT